MFLENHPKQTAAKFSCFLLLVFFIASCTKTNSFRQVNVSAPASSAATLSTKPNIIIFIGDDVGFEIPAYNGGQTYSTPNLDFMANNGVQFQEFYTHPDGSPTRQAFLTGKYNFRNYLGWGYLPPGEKTVANLLKRGGYATCYTGKWQLSGGDKRIRQAGFDKYRVFLPTGHGQRVNRYKDPKLFESNAYLPDSVTKGRFSEDMFYDYVSNFIDSNKTKPFFTIFSHNLPAQPWVPTPDDPDFATWSAANDNKLSNKKYFPGMIAYMDKTIGKVIKKVQDAGIANNTIIMFIEDNATDTRITSLWRGQVVTGTKTTTAKKGTNSPFVAYWPGVVPHQVTTTIVDVTDFMPTLAALAGITVPATYGTMDGVSFYDNLMGTTGKDRSWTFCQWDNDPTTSDVLPERYVNDQNYKLYDTVGIGNGKFYRIGIDPYELNAIPDSGLTTAEKQIKENFKLVLSTMHN